MRAAIAALGASLLALGCVARAPMPYAITSLAVLPTDTTPYHQAAGRTAGEYVTAALLERTSFRVIPIDSTMRLLAGPQGLDWYRRFRDSAATGATVAPSLATAIANRVNAQGLVLPRLSVAMRGLVDGRVALSIEIYEPQSGLRVWMNRNERNFRGAMGDPGFLRVVHDLADELIATMPRPVGEED